MDNGRSFGEQEVASPERVSSWQLSTVLVNFVRLTGLDKISMSSVNSALFGRMLQNHSLPPGSAQYSFPSVIHLLASTTG